VTSPAAPAHPAPAAPTAERGRGLALVALAAVIWSTGGLLVRVLDTDVWTTVWWRSLFASVFLWAWVAVGARSGTVRAVRAVGRPGLVVAGCFALASIALVAALERTTVANTLIMVSTAPLVTAILARVVLGEAVRARTWAAVAAALVGVAIMVSGSVGGGSLAGDAIAGVIPLALAVATVTIRRHHHITMAPAMALGTVLAAVVALPLAGGVALPPAGDLGLLVVFGSFQLGAGLALFSAGARLAPSAEVALVSLLEPVLGPAWVWLVVGEDPGPAALVGGSIVLVALALSAASDLRRRRRLPPMA
jgi:drug/metabolite transporter (DMT)-like permease